MPDADDYDVEELRRLLKGEGAPRETSLAPARESRDPALAKARKKAGPAATGKKRGTVRKRA